MRLLLGSLLLLGTVDANEASQALVRAEILRQPAGWRELPAVAVFDQTWLSVSGGTLWTLDPARRVVHRDLLKTGRTEDGATRTWALPPLMARSGKFAVDLVGDQQGGAWLIDRHAQQFWRLDGASGFSPARQIGEAVGSAAAGFDGTLLLNTPRHSAFAFAIYGPDGLVRRRFGSRRSPSRELSETYANTWRVGALPGGHWLAAHAFTEDIIRLDGDGRVLWHARASTESVRSLKRATVPDNVLHYATVLIPKEETFLVRYGTLSALDEFSLSGKWMRTLPRISDAQSAEQPWITGGASAAGEDALVTAEPPYIVRYVLADIRVAARTRLRVETEASAAVRNARVLVHVAGRSQVETRTDREGAATIEDIARDMPVAVEVSAQGYLSASTAGSLEDVAAHPIRLRRSPQLCLSVSDRASGAPLTRFSVAVAREHLSAQTGRLDVGVSQTFDTVDGPRCVAPPHDAPWQIKVTAPGYASYHGRAAEAGLHRIELESGSSLVVTVTDERRQPVDGATVSVESSRFVRGNASLTMTEDASRTTSSDGRAKWDDLAADEYRIRVMHATFLPAVKTIEIAGPTATDISLHPGGRIAVLVRDASEHALGDATVQLLPGSHTLATEVLCTTDWSGACHLAPAPIGTVDVRASAAHHLPARQRVVVPPDGEASTIVTLRRGTRITGTVERIREYAPTTFEVAVGVHGSGILVSPTSESGDFAFEEVAVGRNSLWVRESGSSSAMLFEEISVEPGGTHLLVQLPAPIRLFGAITSDGRPCPACALTIVREGAEVGAAAVRPTVQLDGSYEAKLPGRGTYRIKAVQAGVEGGVTDTLKLESDQRFDISMGRATLAGQVTARDRARVLPPAAVALYNESGAHVAEVVTDEAGRFRLSGLTKGRYRLVATAGALSGEATVSVSHESTKDVDVVLDDRYAIRVRLRDALSGVMVPTADVTVASGGGATHFVGLRPDEAGLFSIPTGGTGRVNLVIKARGFAYKTVYEASAADAPFDIPLTPGGRSFSVDVATVAEPCAFELLSGGLPVGLMMDRAPGRVPLSLRRALFNELEPGSYVAVVTTCDGRRYEQVVSLVPGHVPLVRFSSQ